MTSETVEVDSGRLRSWPLPGLVGNDTTVGGSVLIVGGSRSAPGAALLSATAALRAGAKKVQVLTVRSVAAHVAVAVPELLVEGGDETEDGELAPAAAATAQEMAKEVDVVLVGPGFMNPQAATDLCRALVPRLQNRLVVDARGIGLRRWGLQEGSGAIALLDRSGDVLFFKEGGLTDDEVRTVVALVRERLR